MSQPVTLTAPLLICPDDGAIYSLNSRAYRLMNGKGRCLVAHLVNYGTGPATLAGSIAGSSGTITIEAHDGFMVGWSPQDTTWRALRMCEVRIAGPADMPPDAQLGPVPTDAPLLVEALDGISVRASLSVIAAYLTGKTPSPAGSQPSAALVV